MSRILRSPQAEDDLLELWTYIAADSAAAADRMLGIIDEKLRVLATNPRIGFSRPDIADGLRVFPIRRYVVLYRVLPDGIDVVRIVHGMRRLDGILDH